jgi:hypothetical protein
MTLATFVEPIVRGRPTSGSDRAANERRVASRTLGSLDLVGETLIDETRALD